jgi:hypothetical protein
MDLHVSPRPASRHALAASVLLGEFGPPFHHARGGSGGRYARESVSHLWLVNPVARTLEVYRLAEGRWLLLATHEGAARVRAEPFDAVELDLTPLWGEGG